MSSILNGHYDDKTGLPRLSLFVSSLYLNRLSVAESKASMSKTCTLFCNVLLEKRSCLTFVYFNRINVDLFCSRCFFFFFLFFCVASFGWLPNNNVVQIRLHFLWDDWSLSKVNEWMCVAYHILLVLKYFFLPKWHSSTDTAGHLSCIHVGLLAQPCDEEHTTPPHFVSPVRLKFWVRQTDTWRVRQVGGKMTDYSYRQVR